MADAALRMEFLDAADQVVRTLHPKPAGYDEWDDARKSTDTGPWLPTQPGVNRCVWDMRNEGAERVPGNKTAAKRSVGPLVLPGTYTVRLHVGDETLSAVFEIVNDPRVDVDAADLEAQLALLLRMRDKVSDAHRAVNKLRDVRRAGGELEESSVRRRGGGAGGRGALAKLASIEDELIQPGDQKNTYGLDPAAAAECSGRRADQPSRQRRCGPDRAVGRAIRGIRRGHRRPGWEAGRSPVGRRGEAERVDCQERCAGRDHLASGKLTHPKDHSRNNLPGS